jgi:phosphoglucomutase
MSVELKLTTQKPANFYTRAARSFLEGVPEKDGKPAKPPVDTVTLTALGNAINAAVSVATTLEKEGLVVITSVRTKFTAVVGPIKRSPNMTVVLKRKGAIKPMSGSLAVTTEATSPIEGQKPGTSGLRKKTKVFMQKNYLNNFVQAVFDALKADNVAIEGGTLVVSGDGRFWNKDATQIIIKMAVANGVKTVWVGQDGLLSTPAASAVIRNREGGFVPFGGFILSASHNPGGLDEDFGIKFNCENGGPAPEKVTETMFSITKSIKEYKICKGFPDIDISTPGSYVVDGKVRVEVFSCTDDHTQSLSKVFDFDAIKELINRKDFSFVYDSMNGVQGPNAKRILCDELGADPSSLMNAVPKEDFGGKNSPSHGHADPNLTYAVELVAKMGTNKVGEKVGSESGVPEFGAAADGDADRNMILGKQWFVSPSDSLAIIAANASCIPFFKGGLKGCARSMPTSGALDLVAKKKKIPVFVTPTGWKFFGNLMDSGDEKYFPSKESYVPFLCGEESFGTGSNHVREKDGMWAVLAWLQILASKNKDASKKFVSVEEITKAHWKEYGRNYYCRYDYEGVDAGKANEMMDGLKAQCAELKGKEMKGMKVATAENFAYKDPVDDSVSENQGINIIFTDGSRIVFRLSGTGSAGATIRLYLEKYEKASGDLNGSQFEVVKPLAELALEISNLPKLTGRDSPTVIT